MKCYFYLCRVFAHLLFFFFKQKTAYEMRISDWSSDVCSSDLSRRRPAASSPSSWTARTRLRPPKRSRPWWPTASMRNERAGGWRSRDRKSVAEGKSVSVRVDLGGRRHLKRKS